MANFPTALPQQPTNFSNATAVASSIPNNQNGEINAIGAKVGIDGSAVTTSHDYKLGEVTGSDKAVGKTATQVMSNKTLDDATTLFQDNSDNAKKFRFEASGITTGNTRVYTMPDAATTLVGRDTTDTLTNKTISTGSALDANASENFTYHGMARQAVKNGNFNQKADSESSVTDPDSGLQVADGWYVEYSKDGGTDPTILAIPIGGLSGFDFYAGGAGSGYGANSYHALYQRIYNAVRHLAAEGSQKTVTLSFQAKSDNAGKKLGFFLKQNYGLVGSPTSEETIVGSNVTLTTSWVTYTHTFTLNTLTGKTFGTDGLDYLELMFYLQWGTTTDANVGATTAEDFVASGNNYIRRVQINAGSVALPYQPKDPEIEKKETDIYASKNAENLLDNGGFNNVSTNGYGGVPDDWTESSANTVQGGFPEMTKQQIIDLLGVTTAQIEGLWNLNGNFNDLSDNGYNLTASGSPTDSDDGLMAQGKLFTAASSQYAENSAANTQIVGDQTWVIFFKPATIGAIQRLIGRCTSAAGNRVDIMIDADGYATFQAENLTTNTEVISTIKCQANKWYMLVGIYDKTNTKLKIWVNGLKTEVTASGDSTVSGTLTTSIGRAGASSSAYANGITQAAMMLSVALSDDQVKRLWAFTTYKGIKIRRASGTPYIQQTIPQHIVEQYRGKYLTVRFEAFNNTAFTDFLYADIENNNSSKVTMTGSIKQNTWEERFVSRYIDPETTYITLKFHLANRTGCAWVKNVSLYEGRGLRNYSPSARDWSRFPRLLRLDPPPSRTGFEYEEERWYSYTPYINGSGGSLGTYAQDLVNARYLMRGKRAEITLSCRMTNLGSWSGDVQVHYPVVSSTNMSDKTYWPIMVTAQSSNPITAAKGIAVSKASEQKFYQVKDSINSSVLQWSGLSANDTFFGQGVIEIN